VSQNFQKMQQNIARISALASKMGRIKKIKSFDYIKWYIITNLHDNVPLSYFVALLENFKTPQFCSEIK
jgi:hypothetical protein